ncbi:FYB [Branchiostoma lanceolatum]|uniref:FYB protein n=1 Tax=Branchiostoma lanceolatum TaxID=7740 RepID=A0A8J9YXZ8_BRALA|nr:FYB [Branchiostoma lanceolatum]
MEGEADDIYDDPKSLSNQTSVKAIAQMFAKQQVEPVKPAPQPTVPKKTWKPPVNSGGNATPIIMMKPPTAKKPDVPSRPEPHSNKPAVPKRSPGPPGMKPGLGISMDELKQTIKKKSTGSTSDLSGSKPQVPRRSPQTTVSPTIPRSPLKPVNNSPKAAHDNERIPAPSHATPTENEGGKGTLQPLPPLEVLGEPPKKPARPPEVQLPDVQTEGQNRRSLPAPPQVPDEVFEDDEDGDMYEDVETARARLNKERQEEIKPMEEEDEEDVYEDTENRPPPLPSPRTPGLPTPVPSALHGMGLPATPRNDEPEPEDDETYDDIMTNNQQRRNDSEEEGEDEDLYEGLDEVQEQVSQLDRRMGTFSHLSFRLWGSNGQVSKGACGKSESTEDILDKDKKARKKDEKLRKEQERKEQKEKEEREKREKKEQKRREKEEKEVKKKFKLRPDDKLETLSRGCVVHVPDKATKHDKLDLLVKEGELLTVVKMEDCPDGKWLARNADGRYGYIIANSLEMDTQTGKSSSSSFLGVEEEDEGTYDDCRQREEEAAEEDVYEEF